MANNYTQFSMSISKLTPEEERWLRDELGDFYDRDLPEEEIEKEAVEEAFCEERGIDFPEEWPGFSAEFYSPQHEVVLFSEDAGNPDCLAFLLRAFLKKFRPTEVLGFEAAFTCSKPRPDEFGGVAYFVTSDGMEVMSTTEWLIEKIRERG